MNDEWKMIYIYGVLWRHDSRSEGREGINYGRGTRSCLVSLQVLTWDSFSMASVAFSSRDRCDLPDEKAGSPGRLLNAFRPNHEAKPPQQIDLKSISRSP